MNEMTPMAVDFEFVASMKAKYNAQKDLVKVCVQVFIILIDESIPIVSTFGRPKVEMNHN